MEGRGLSGLYKNSSEELFLRNVIENPIGMPLPSMDMLNFKAVSQSFRADGEELFKRWLTNEEGYNSSSKGLNNSRLSQRMSTELSNLPNQQNVCVVSEGRSNDKLYVQNNPMPNVADFNQFPLRDPADTELQSSNLFLAKAWFISDQRMIRSRSSELRRRYAEIQIAEATQGMESLYMNPAENHADTIKQECSNFNGFDYNSICELPNQKGEFVSPSNSSSSTFDKHQLDDTDKVSSCVNMLKGTLELKRLNKVEKQAVDNSSNGVFCPQDAIFKADFGKGRENSSHQKTINFQGASIGQAKDLEASINLDLDGLENQTNAIYLETGSCEPSQSESSAIAPVVSYSLDGYEVPNNSNLALCESSWKQIGVISSENKVKGVREKNIDNLKDNRNKGSLERHGSVTSAISDDKCDATKKRRMERSRKMAEAKERNLTPSIPSDLQTILKRCEILEKEVRSLKLNLSFMNRKDSEQTKQIEDLQRQNDELADEKERLLEEIERILSETRKV